MKELTKFSPSTSSIDLVPIDIWIKITSSFSIKSLVTLSSVNKPFLDVIADPTFISDHHLRRSNSGDRFLTYETGSNGSVFAINEIENASEKVRKFGRRKSRIIDRVKKPGLVAIRAPRWNVVCSVDGLVVLSTSRRRSIKTSRTAAVVWNPSIRKHRQLKLPAPAIEQYFGLGYRSESWGNDYKVVTLHASQDEAWIYIIRTDSWYRITNRRFHDHDKVYTYSMSLSLKHTIVWIESVYDDLISPPSKRLLFFGFETETFRYTNLPCSVNRNMAHERLTLLDGGSTVGVWWADVEGEIYIWALDMNTMNWAVRYKLGPVGMKFKAVDRSMFVEKDGELVWRYWEENGCLRFLTFLFDFEKKFYRMKCLGIIRQCLDIYEESLVMIN